MSNRTLRDRIAAALDAYRKGEAPLSALRDAVVQNGRAMEAMPYSLVKQIDDIEYALTAAQWAEEEDCLPQMGEALSELDGWLRAVPLDV